MGKKQRKNKSSVESKTIQRKAFYHRIRTISEKMVGPGIYELFPESSLRLMYNNRYPPIKVEAGDGHVMTETEAIQYQKNLVSLLSNHYVDTLTGERISCARFLTDMLVLIHYAQYSIVGRFRGYKHIMNAFNPYFVGGEWYIHWRDHVLRLMGIADIELYDFYRGWARSSAQEIALVNPGKKNILKVYRIRSKTCLQDIDGKKRVLAKLGVPSTKEIKLFDWPKHRPSMLGFENSIQDEPMPFYVQQHALNRFHERTYFPPGYAQLFLANMFASGSPNFLFYEGATLLPCYIGIHKVGYFVIRHHEDKWVLRTFLFLTNDGTPEGFKLKELTDWGRLDKAHLRVDRLDAFLNYNISGDPGLRRLFVKAGCGPLLRLSDEIVDRVGFDPEPADYIYQYMCRA